MLKTKSPNDLCDALAQRRLQFRGGSGQHEVWDAGAIDALSPGTRLLLDLGTIHVGQVRWPPGLDVSRLVPMVDGMWPDRFADDGTYRAAISMWSLAEGAGVLSFITSARGALQVLGQLYAKYLRSPEAARDLLPALRIEDPMPYAPKANPAGTVFAPAYTPLGWLPRPSMFGARSVPLPRALTAPEGQRRRLATDALFDDVERQGELLLPQRRRGFEEDPA